MDLFNLSDRSLPGIRRAADQARQNVGEPVCQEAAARAQREAAARAEAEARLRAIEAELQRLRSQS